MWFLPIGGLWCWVLTHSKVTRNCYPITFLNNTVNVTHYWTKLSNHIMNSLHELQRFLNYVHNGQVDGKKTINYDFVLMCTCTVIRSFQLREEENLKKGLQLLF